MIKSYAAAVVLVAAHLLLPGAAHSVETCTTRPGVGNTTLTTCRDGSGGPAQQYRTRAGVGGGSTITTGPNGKTCTTRPAVGGGTSTTCR
jgi:hypothetical protein